MVNPFKTGRVNVRFVWPEIFSKLLQKGMSVPNSKAVGTKLRSAERRGLHKVLKNTQCIICVISIGAHFVVLVLDLLILVVI